MAKQTGTDLDDIATGGSKRARIDDTIPVFKFPPKKWVTLRLFGPLFTYGNYWIKTKTREGKKTTFPTPCPSYDPATQTRDSTKFDPWRDLEEKQSSMEKDDQMVRFSKTGFQNAIFRKAQADAPRKSAKHTRAEVKTGFKERDSDSYTPVVPLRLPFGAISKIKEQGGLNVVEIKGQTKSFSVTHPKYGCDIRIMHNPDKAPADQYQVSIGERTPLTEEELAYLKYDLSELEEPMSDSEIKRDFESWAKRNGVKITIGKKKKADEEDEDFPDDDGEDDEPVSKKKSKKSSDEDEDDFDDEEPVSKKKVVKKKKPADDEDDFDDEDSEDEDEEEDEEPVSKKKKVTKKKPVDEDEDDDFGDDEDEEDSDDEDEDEPVSKKKKVVKKPVSKKKKPADDEDDFEDDFDDEDEEEDDEPVSKKKVVKKAVSKKKPVDDEEDDFDDEDSEDDDSEEDESEDDEDDEPVTKKKVVKKPVKKVRR